MSKPFLGHRISCAGLVLRIEIGLTDSRRHKRVGVRKLVLGGEPPVDVTLRRSARARRLSLRVSGLDGRVTLTVPRGVPERTAHSFLTEKEGWLRGHLAARPPRQAVRPGVRIPYRGRLLAVLPGAGRAVRLGTEGITVPGPDAAFATRLRAFLIAEARTRLQAAAQHHTARLGRPFAGLALRDTRSRWGSCSAAGRLMFSWRLIMAPPEVLDYVAAHEVAHLAEMNHSSAFWAVVTRLCPGHAAPRAWLRAEGPGLHRYDFAAPASASASSAE